MENLHKLKQLLLELLEEISSIEKENEPKKYYVRSTQYGNLHEVVDKQFNSVVFKGNTTECYYWIKLNKLS